MRDLDVFRRTATTVLGSASYDLRTAADAHAPTSPTAGRHLGQLAAELNPVIAGVPYRVMRGTTGLSTPTMPDPWMVGAGVLHNAVTNAYDAIVGLLKAAGNARHIVPVSGAASVAAGNQGLFGFEPCDDAFDGWTSPHDLQALESLDLTVGSPAWARRAQIVWATDRWAIEHQAALAASGAATLIECARDLCQMLVSIRAAMVEVAISTVAASWVKARAAARIMVAIGDDPADLVGLARAHAAEQEVPASLTWGAVADLLAAAERG